MTRQNMRYSKRFNGAFGVSFSAGVPLGTFYYRAELVPSHTHISMQDKPFHGIAIATIAGIVFHLMIVFVY